MKKTMWITVLSVLMLLAACQEDKTSETKEVPVKEDIKTIPDSTLAYRFYRVENKTAEETAKAFKSFLEEEGMYYPKFIDFQKAAALDNNPVEMPQTILVIFGNPKEMAKLINENPEVALDLPFRILIYKDTEGNVLMTYEDFESFKKRHFLADSNGILKQYAGILKRFEKKLSEAQIKKAEHQN